MEPRNAAQDIIDGKGSSKTQRRSSFSPFRALRALSVSSQLSDASDTSNSAAATTAPPAEKGRTLRKTRTTETFRQDLYRAPSKGSSQYALDQLSVSTRPTTPSVSGSRAASIADDFAGVLKSGALQADASLLKPKRGYLVLTSALLVKFKSRPAAVDHFPQISRPVSAVDSLGPVESVLSFRNFGSAAELQIPLEKVVTVFKDESVKPFFGIEVWWKDTVDGSTFTSVELDFRLPEERDDWIRQIRLAVKQRTKAVMEDRTPSHVEADIIQILAAKNPGHTVERPDIFPVIPRRPYTRLSANPKEIKKGWREGSSFYLAFGKNVCLLAQFSKSPTGQRVNPSLVPFGLVNLSQVNATVGDERFDLIFRLPLDAPKKLQVASRHHRTIIARLIKADTVIKPAWPLWTRRETFFVDGESDQIHLPVGEDLGGFKRTLEAFLEGYYSAPVNWKVNWTGVRCPPEFRLLPPTKKPQYTAHQLLAVFRALRFNDFFKSLSFAGIDFTPLAGIFDNEKRLEPTAWLSRTGKRSLNRDEYDVLESSSVLFQEVAAMMLASESVKQIDFSGVLGRQFHSLPASRDLGCEILPPILLLLRSLQTRCKSIFLNHNPLSAMDVDELCQTLQNYPGLMRCLGLSRCNLGEAAMVSIWEALHEQRSTLEVLEFANNASGLAAERVANTLCDASNLRRLDLAYCLKGSLDGPLFSPWTTSWSVDPWRLEYLNLSGWKVNFDTISRVLRYMETDASQGLRHLVLNNCGINGDVATAIFCGIQAGRDMHLHLNGNPLGEVSTDWIDLIHGNEGPRRLNLDMIQFRHESNFNRLLKALTHNSRIEFLSMVGTGPPASASAKTLTLLSKFFEDNTTLQYLDLSGYSGKLEDSHMGWGLSGALGGLRHNSTLRQLRLRNHDIGEGDDVTELCRVLASNQGLVMFDLRNNNFSHQKFSAIVHSLDFSHRIISFPIGDADGFYALEEEKRTFLAKLVKPGRGSAKPLSKADNVRVEGQMKWVRGHWDTEVARLEGILRRNRESPANRALAFDDEYLEAWGDPDLPGWLSASDPSTAAARASAAPDLQHSRSSSTSSTNYTLSSTSASASAGPASSAASDHTLSREGSGPSSRLRSKTYTIEEEASSSSTSNNTSSEFIGLPSPATSGGDVSPTHVVDSNDPSPLSETAAEYERMISEMWK